MGQSPVTQSRIGRICLVCTHWETCLSCGVNTPKKKACGNMKNDLKTPKAGHPPCLNVCGRRATIWPTLTCRNPHVSLTFLSTMHPSVCEGALWPLTLWSSDLSSPVIPKTLDACSVHGSENNLIYTFAPWPAMLQDLSRMSVFCTDLAYSFSFGGGQQAVAPSYKLASSTVTSMTQRSANPDWRSFAIEHILQHFRLASPWSAPRTGERLANK